MRFIKATLSLFLVLVFVITTVVSFLEFRTIRGKVSHTNSLPRSISPIVDTYERNRFDSMPTVSGTIICSRIQMQLRTEDMGRVGYVRPVQLSSRHIENHVPNVPLGLF